MTPEKIRRGEKEGTEVLDIRKSTKFSGREDRKPDLGEEL